MRVNHCITIFVVALTAAAPTVNAQQAADPVMPRVGSWGAEAVFGSGIGANALRFSSPTAAWLAGLSFYLTHQSDDRSALSGGTNQSGWWGFGDARLGRRSWSGGQGERVRPLTGMGVIGGVSGGNGVQSWNVGGYGELGATYFFSPHVSLGANGELAASYIHDRVLNTSTERIITRWVVRGNLVRVNASVYF